MTHLKKSLAMLLALIMMFSSMSVAATAWDESEDPSNITFTVKFFRESPKNSGNWIETDKAAPGEKVKLRVYIETGFYTTGGETCLIFDKDFFSLIDVENASRIDLTVNENYSGYDDDPYGAGEYDLKSTGAWYDKDHFYKWNEKFNMDYILAEIEEDSKFFETHEFLSSNIYYEGSKVNCRLDGSQWLYEYDLLVNNNDATKTIDGEGEAKVPPYYNSYSRWLEAGDLIIDITKGREGSTLGDTGDNVGMFLWEPVFKTNPDTISTTSTIFYDMGLVNEDGEWTEDPYTFVDGIIGMDAKLSEITNPVHPDGLTFSHWSTQKPGKGVTQNKVSAINYDYDAQTLYAVWSEPSDVNYTLKQFYMNADGSYPNDVEGVTKSAAPNATVSAPVSTDPLFVLDEAKSDKNVVIDANGSSVVNAYYERVKYNLVYHYEDMSGAQTDIYSTRFGAPLHTFDAVDSHIPEKTGYTFLGWSTDINGKEPETLPSVMPTNDLHLYPVYAPGETYDVEHIFDAGNGGTFSDGEQLRRYTYKFGEDVIIPEAPTVPGKEFTGWDGDIPEKAYEDRRFEAMYEDIIYTVTFKADMNKDGTYETTVKEVDFTYGEKLYPEFAPEKFPLDVWMLEDGTAVEISDKETAYTVTDNVVIVTKGPNEYPARFYWSEEDMNNGAEPYTTIYVEYDTSVPSPTAPEKDGYNFIAWTPDTDSGLIMDSKDGMDIFAIFEAKDITVTYDPNGGACGVESETVKYEESVTLPEATREGYEFLGWFDGKDKVGDAGDSYAVPTENVTLKAEWDAEEHTITFLDGENKLGEIKADTDDEIKVPEHLNPPVKKGYNFTGWVTEKQQPSEVPAKMPAEDMVLIATWETVYYDITADANGGKFSDGSDTFTDEKAYGDELKIEEPKKDGHKFLGWANADDENNTIITLPKEMPDEAINIKAVWDTNKHNVVYDAAGGTFEGNGSTKTYFDIEYGAKVPVPESNPIKDKNIFIRWSPEIPAAMPDKNLEFIAIWEEIPEPDDQVYDIYVSYPNPSAPGETTEKKVTSGAAKPGTTVGIIKAGEPANADKVHTYEEIVALAGVDYIEPDYDNRPAVVTIAEGENKIVVSFKLKEYTVTFNPNGGNFNGSEESVVESGKFGETVNAPADPVRKGYTFMGWDKDVPDTFSENTVINATWEIQKHNAIFVVYDENGVAVKTITNEYKYGETIYAPNYTAPEGYEFKGWTVPAGTVMGEGDITFETTLVPVHYSITYEISGLPEDKLVSVPKQSNLRLGEEASVAAAPEVDGYSFSGWTYGEKAYPSDGTGIIVIDGNITLKGTYSAIEYTISFDSDGAGEVSDRNYKCDETVRDLPMVSKEGYSFVGWFEDGEKIEAPFTMPARDMKLKAEWEKNEAPKATITLDADGGEFEGGKATVIITGAVDSPVDAPEEPTKKGFEFDGWVNENGEATDIPEKIPANDVTIKAKWAELYDVTYYDTDNTTVFQSYPDAGKEGADLPVPETVPTKEGATFAGWVDAEGNAVTEIPAGNVELYPSWTTNAHTVTYNAGEGSFANGKNEVKFENVVYGAAVPTVDEVPVRDGYEFVRWTPEAPEAMVDEDLVFTAEWKEIPKPEAQTYEIWVSYPNPVNPEEPIEKVIITGSALPGTTVEILKSGETQTADKAHTYDEIIAKVDANGVEPDYDNRPGVTTIGENNKIVVNFKLTEYTAEFDGNGGLITDAEGNEVEKVILKGYYGQPVDIPGDDEVYREGYSFAGWDGNVPETFTENTVAKATWEKEIYDARFYIIDENGDEILYKTESFEFGDEIVAPEYTPDEGYVFSGWDVEGETMPAHDVEFTATLTPVGFTLSYVLVGLPEDKGIEAPAAQTGLKAGKDADVAAAPVVPGYDFDGFWKDANGLDYIADGSDKINMPAADVVLYATYTAKDYVIRYNTDGAGSIPNDTYKCDQTVVALPEVSKDGFTFLGWYEGETKVEAPFAMPARDMILNAKWEEVVATKYSIITLDANGGKFSNGAPVYPVKAEVGVPFNAVPADPTREGFEFIGWTDVNGNATSIPKVFPEEDVTIKAAWAELYDVTYYAEDGTTVIEAFVDAGKEGANIPALDEAKIPEKEGYRFIGWDGMPEDGKIPAGDLKLVATYEEIIVPKYTITYISNDVTVNTVSYKENEPIAEYKLDNVEGYTFKGWNPELPSTMPAEDLTVNAVWEINKHDITLDANGGQFEDGTTVFTDTVDYGTELSGVIPAAPSREGYEFIGWDGELPSTMPDEDISLKAQWELKEYTITFDSNGGSEVPSQTYKFGDTVVAPAAPTRDGFTFVKWTPALPSTMPANDITVVAEWEAVVVTKTLTIDANGGVFDDGEAVDTKVLAVGEEIKIDELPVPTRDGYEFAGWEGIPEDGKMPETDLTIKATWSPVAVPEHNVEYYYAVGGALYDTLTFKEGETIVHPAGPAVEGFTFIGWADENGNELPEVMGKEDIKAYAQFEVNKYKVTYIVDGSVYKEYEVAYQAEVPVPADPADSATRLFAGWQPNVEDIMPAHDLTYTATWVGAPEPDQYTATFLRHNGETHAKYVLEEGDVIPVPAAPERFGYVFVGWEPAVPDTMPGHDMVFKPKYEIDKTFVTIVIGGGVVIAGGAIAGSIIGGNIAAITGVSIVGGILVIVGIHELVKHTHTVTYIVDGEVYKTYKVVEGTRIPVPADPVKDGFSFEGWNPEVPKKMGKEDLVFEATWSEKAVDDSSPEVDVPVPDTGSVAGGLTAFAVISGAAAAAYVITRRKKED